MVVAANLGFPRIGAGRELKKALERFWKGESAAADLLTVAKGLREQNWQSQRDAGIDIIPSGDFALYDIMLDHVQMLGCAPARYAALADDALAQSFAMARGYQRGSVDVVAMEMTKWFDTNYHYIVPEFEANQHFSANPAKLVEHMAEARALGITTRPVIIGPVTFLLLGKMRGSDASPLSLLPALLPVYAEIIKALQAAGAESIQIDEPCLVMDLSAEAKAAYKTAYAELAKVKTSATFCLSTYFESLGDNLALAFGLPVEAVHLDLVRGASQLEGALKAVAPSQSLSLGVVDGRNIWKNNFDASLTLINKAVVALGVDRVMVAPSCSLLHTPVDLAQETTLDDELKSWMAFARQKLDELVTLAKAASGDSSVELALAANRKAIQARRTSARIHNPAVAERLKAITPAMLTRSTPFDTRIQTQSERLALPALPTTTIGSFPQTAEVRKARADYKAGTINEAQYQAFLEKETAACIQKQEALGLDVPVHGEFERNDMVEYFGEQLSGFAFTQHGWVQSYGSRCVKPPVIFGDVSRPKAMTVEWAKFAQAQTKKPMKGMLTGPVTILQWSFVRDDQPRELTCKQIGLAIRDEVMDLEAAGIPIIQIDEAALREGLPLRKSDHAAYLRWAVDSFRIAASGVGEATQIHTHMCYSEFNDIIEAVAEMDADVISIETSRSAMELLEAFVAFKYPNQIGPGVYDIHSPRVPNQQEMTALLDKALKVLKPEQIWVNPDCGLKTRGWKEVEPALAAMVAAARELRAKLSASKAA